jgi:hypothetical protein
VIAPLLFDLYASAFSGALLLTRGEIKKIIYLRSGYPIAIRSNIPAECLGKILLWDGKISHDHWRHSLIAMRRTGQRQGSVLIEMGVLTPRQVDQGLELQFRFRLGETFSWTDGSYRIWPGVRHPTEIPVVDIAPATLIQEGVRSFMPPDRVLRELDLLTLLYLHPSSNPLWRFQSMVLPPKAAVLLDKIDGTTRLDDLYGASTLDVRETNALVYSLFCVQMVTPSDDRWKSWSSLKVPQIARSIGPSVPERTRHGDLASLVERLRRAAPHEVLGVPHNASASTIRLAFQRRAAERHPDRLGASRARGLRELAIEALRITADAFATLSPEDHMGAPPDRASAPPRSATGAGELQTASVVEPIELFDPSDEFEPTELERAAPESHELEREALPSIEQEVSALFPADEEPEPTMESVSTDSGAAVMKQGSSLEQELGALIMLGQYPEDLTEEGTGATPQPTHDTHSKVVIGELSSTSIREPQDDSSPSRVPPSPIDLAPHAEPARAMDGTITIIEDTNRREPTDSVRFPKPPDYSDEPRTAPVVPPPGSYDDRLWQIIEAEQYHRQGLILLDRGRFAEAVAVLSRAVDLCAEEGEFRVSLAWAIFQAGLDDEAAIKALKHIEQAVMGAPSARVYLFRGHILRFLDRQAEAVWAYEEALRQEPDNEEARSELERISESSRRP